MTNRYALLGLANARSSWFGALALWVTSGALPAEFSKCLSASELVARLNSLQQHSAVLIEAGLPELDRDLIEAAKSANAAVIIVTNQGEHWLDMGADAVLQETFTPNDLLQVLAGHARIISEPSQQTSIDELDRLTTSSAPYVAVCGPGGTGASSLAIAISQGLSAVLSTDHVLLADLTRNGEQAMLHDARDVVPGIEELVEMHRAKRPNADEIKGTTFVVPQRQYQLLLGLCRLGAWTSLPPRAIAASLDSLRSNFAAVVADITADFEGESDCGSMDVEERNSLARQSIAIASIIVVVGVPGLKGTHSLARTIREILATGVEPSRILPVVNQVPKGHRVRTEIIDALNLLVHNRGASANTNEPFFIPITPSIESAFRDGAPLPAQFATPLANHILRCLSKRPDSERFLPFMTSEAAAPIKPGTLSK